MMTTSSCLESLRSGRRIPAVVLFHSGARCPDELRSEFEHAPWPRGYRVCSVDLDTDIEAQRWFNLADGPAVAVVLDGAILALEYECSSEARSRLLRAAAQQRRLLDDV